MILAFRHPGVRVWGVELQEPLATLAAENVCANEMSPQVTILRADLRDIDPDAFGVRWTGSFPTPPIVAGGPVGSIPSCNGRWPGMK